MLHPDAYPPAIVAKVDHSYVVVLRGGWVCEYPAKGKVWRVCVQPKTQV